MAESSRAAAVSYTHLDVYKRQGAIGWRSSDTAMAWMEELTPGAIRRVVDIAVNQDAGVASFDGALWRMTDEYWRLSPTQPHGPTRLVVDSTVLADTPCCTMAVRHRDGDLQHIAELVAAEADSAALSHVGRSTVLDVTAEGVDKGLSLIHISTYRF